jgi:pimeloyl-ACP methyl ester carboxylesterase
MRATFVGNAPTFLDETRDPDSLMMDLGVLGSFDKPSLLTSGTSSPPFFAPVVDTVAAAIPGAQRTTIEGADHLPHVSMPERYVELVKTFAEAA